MANSAAFGYFARMPRRKLVYAVWNAGVHRARAGVEQQALEDAIA
jgi:hypothetical protein